MNVPRLSAALNARGGGKEGRASLLEEQVSPRRFSMSRSPPSSGGENAAVLGDEGCPWPLLKTLSEFVGRGAPFSLDACVIGEEEA